MIENLKQRDGFWTSCGPYSHIILSSRLRLARNMAGLPFPNRIVGDEFIPVEDAIIRFTKESIYREDTDIIALRDIDSHEKRYLRERNLITFEMEISNNSLVAINRNNDFAILVNEEDHFRIQVIKPGLQLVEVYKEADTVDSELNRYVSYAFSDELGYLTACTSNLGTGLRISAILHLPAISMNKKIHEIISEVKNSGANIKSTIGNGDKSAGCFYQISNRASLGLSEIDIIETLDNILCKVIEREENERDRCLSNSRIELEDSIWRSFGQLVFSRKISYLEALEHLSKIRLGVVLAFIKKVGIQTINDLMVNIQWAHLQSDYGGIFKGTADADEYRAEYLRRQLKSIKAIG